MAVTSFASGTQTCTINTEYFLSSPNEAGVYELELDLNALANGDVLEVRIYNMVLTAETSRVMLFYPFHDAQPEPKIAISEPISNDLTDTNALRFSIKQTAGTGRSIPWKVLKHA